MKKLGLIAGVAVVAAIAVYAINGQAQDAAKVETPKPGFTVALKGHDEAAVGTADITATPKGVLLSVNIDKMAPGWHAIHFHGVGDCSDHTDHFKKSGGHAAAEGQEHGYFAATGPHAGDLTNFYVHADGTAKFVQYSTDMTAQMLDDADGTALVIHANPDDYVSAPAGNAGDRLGCGVISKAD